MDSTDGEPDDTTERVVEITLGVYCTEARAQDLARRFELLLCPDPEHAGPCAVPWTSRHRALADAEAAERYPVLVEQVYHERGVRREQRP